MSIGAVWYVAYGSNTLWARFRCYLEGGRAVGSRRPNPGARDPSPPTSERATRLPHPVRFGGESLTWNGGPAFLDIEAVGESPGRAWRITLGQLEDVVAQENGAAAGSVSIDRLQLLRGDIVLPARYGRLVALPPIDGEPAVTITRSDRPRLRAPDPAYLALIEAGLDETRRLAIWTDGDGSGQAI